jgi:hypothetical protein
MESNGNHDLGKCIKPKTEIEWNQTENKKWGKLSNRKPKLNDIKPKPSIERFQTKQIHK